MEVELILRPGGMIWIEVCVSCLSKNPLFELDYLLFYGCVAARTLSMCVANYVNVMLGSFHRYALA